MTAEEPDPRAEPLVLASAGHEPTGWFDLARVLAILAVVVVHETSGEVGGRDAGDPATAAWWTANLLDSASRWCVPVFLMVSGALLLDPRRTDRPRDFYRRRLSRIGVPLVVWTAVYLVFRSLYLGDDLDAGQAARDVAAGTPVPAALLPLRARRALPAHPVPAPRRPARDAPHAGGVRRGPARARGRRPGGRVVPRRRRRVGGDPVPAVRRLLHPRLAAAGRPPDPPTVRLAAAAFGGSVVATAGLVAVTAVAVGWGTPGRYLYGYLSPTVVVMSLSAYVLLRAWGLRHPPGSRWAPGRRAAALSALTFGVYLVHPLFLYPLSRVWPVPQAWPLWVGVTAAHLVVTVGGSLALTWVILRVPVLRRTI